MLKYEHYWVDEYTGEIADHEWQLPTGNHSEIWAFSANDFNVKIWHKMNGGYICDGYEWPNFRTAAQYVQALFGCVLA